MDINLARRCIFRPYLRGKGPSFTLMLWDDVGYSSEGKLRLRYRLTQAAGGKKRVIFEGSDFYLGLGCTSDSDNAVIAVMAFLTVCPGDTDSDYFHDYTPEQLAFCNQHADALMAEVMFRFNGENR